MRLVSRGLCLAALAVSLLALTLGGLAWGWHRLDESLTRQALQEFVRQTMTQSSDGKWGEVRSVSSRDALDGLECHRSEWTWSTEAEVRYRNLESGSWALWVKTPRGGLYTLRVDDLTWHPLPRPWRRHQFRLVAFDSQR